MVTSFFLCTYTPFESEFEHGVETLHKIFHKLNLNQLVEKFFLSIPSNLG